MQSTLPLFGQHSDTLPSTISPNIEHIRLENDGHLFIATEFFPESLATRYFQELSHSIAWKQDHIKIHGKSIAIPRLQAWYGDPDTQYSYSGLTMAPRPFNDVLKTINQKIRLFVNQLASNKHSVEMPIFTSPPTFNSVLCNYYRNGQDGVSWHADDERELGVNPVIASVSLGETRSFKLKHKKNKALTYDLPLPHNTLLIMAGSLQHHWYHQIGKTKKVIGPRVNLTYREIKHSS